MDAATKIKTLLTALFAGFVLAPNLRAEDEPTPPTGIAAIVSDWLSKTPQFSLFRAVNFDVRLDAKTNKLGSSAPFAVQTPADLENAHQVMMVQSDQGIMGTFTLNCSKRPACCSDETVFCDEANTESQTKTPLARTLRIAVPMKFSEQLNRNPIGNLVTEVIACGHRICTGSQCYEVKDGPVSGTHCDTESAAESPNSESHEESFADEEPIHVVPMAPPPPPPVQVVMNSSGSSDSAMVQDIVSESQLQNAKVSIPLSTLMDLMIAKTELSTRLEMTEQIMLEREAVVEKIQQISERNAQLASQLAVAEVRQQMSDVLTASIVERAEIAMKVVSHEATTGSKQESGRSVQAIHEDLSNIRRQIALLRRNQPVAFAPSDLGIRPPSPYIPTAQLQRNDSDGNESYSFTPTPGLTPPSVSQTEREPEGTCEGVSKYGIGIEK
jgi:hypothetical protein